MSPRSAQKCNVNNKDINNKNDIYNNSIYNDVSDKDSINHKKHAGRDAQEEKRLMDEMTCTQMIIKQSVDYDYLSRKPGIDKGLLDDAINLMVEASTFPGRVVINKDVMPLELVQETFDKYDRDIMEYALVQIEKHIIGVTNMKNYMLAVLFNAVSTFNGSLYMEIHEDMYKQQ